ncbi:T9SS type A sorting domain-containing protein [candidate division KSB1 bacterium]|nr:T9SS type A sorting domain-containing protein [candidate division KSB1 bacterium]
MQKLHPIILSILLILSKLPSADVPRTIFAINGSAETISKMTLDNNRITQNIARTGQVPNHIIAYNDMLYIVESGTSDIKILDPKTDRIVRTIALMPGANPWDIEFVGHERAFVSNYVMNTVAVVDLTEGKVSQEIPVGRGPEDIFIVDNLAFVTNTGYAGWGLPYEGGTVNIIDILTDAVIDTIAVPTNPQKAALAPDGRVHVLCTGDYAEEVGCVVVIDLYTGPAWNEPAVVDTIELGGAPGDLAITANGQAYAIAWGDDMNGFLYSYDALNGTVSHAADNPILVGPNVGQVLYDGREECLWIPTMKIWGGDGYVQKFDVATDSVVWTSDVFGNGTQKVALLEKIWEITPWADAVVAFSPGAGAGFGQNYLPDNVLGPPDQRPGLNDYMASNRPQEVLSLGHGGEIILGFADNIIIDGPGADFTVFENPFISMIDDEPFVEAGIVAVSQDGIDFIEFPYDTASWQGLAGVTPTRNSYEFTHPSVSGGDAFDLADVGLTWAAYVKITDLGDIKREGPWNGDFDLDAVVAVNYIANDGGSPVMSPRDLSLQQNYPNPFNAGTTIRFAIPFDGVVSLDIFNVSGQRLASLLNGPVQTGLHVVEWDGCNRQGQPVSSGVYLARLKVGERIEAIRMTLLR